MLDSETVAAELERVRLRYEATADQAVTDDARQTYLQTVQALAQARDRYVTDQQSDSPPLAVLTP